MRYWAFISYSHTDKDWGDWLHKALETYRVPRRLVGKASRDGTVPDRLFPIFRDREELPVSADLGSNINEALRESRYLIVICSPRSAQSQWVDQEVRNFKMLGREDRVLALIVDGEPNASEGKPGVQPADECFPSSMRYRLTEGGTLSPERTEPIAADARPGKDGKENAKLKLLAGLLGIAYDELKQRDHERRLRRARLIGAAAIVLTGIFAGLASWAVIAARQAAAQKRETQLLFIASETARADEFFAKDDAASAVSFLARAAEQEPDTYSSALDRIWFALTQRAWPLPISAPMRHKDAILSASFSPDGAKAVTASRDATARIWDARSGVPIGTALSHRRLVRRALFTADGAKVLTICFDGTARLWDSNTGEAVSDWRIEHPNSINSAALSPSGKRIATGSSDGVVRVSDAATAKRIVEFRQPENVHTLAFHPVDETLLLAVSGPSARLWKIPEGRQIVELPHEAQINSAQFDPRGERLVTASGDGTARLWDTSSGQQIGDALKHDAEVSNAILSGDARYLATLAGNRLFVWEMGAKPILKHSFVHDQRVTCARFTPDNLVIVSGTDGGEVQGRRLDNGESAGERIREDGAIVAIDISGDGKRWLIATGKGEARVWRSPPRYPIASALIHGGAIESMSVSTNGRWLATGSADGKGRIWDLAEPNTACKELPHDTAVLFTNFSPDGKFLVTGAADGKARVWETTSAREAGLPLALNSAISRAIFDPQGKFLVTATEDGSAQSWDVASHQAVGKPMVHGAPLRAMDLGNDGRVLLTAGSDAKLRLWHPKDGEQTGPVLESDAEITCARFSPHGEWIAAGSRSGRINIWSVATGKLVNQFAQNAAITDCAFSPDGRYIASASEDHTAIIREISSERFVGDSLRHASVVSAVVFAPDSSKIATASEDGMVRLWQVSSGRAITEPLLHQKAVRLLAFSPDGRFLYSGSRDRLVKIWDLTTNLTRADRDWLTAFVRSISPFRLNEAGRLEHRSVESREVLQAKLSGASERARVFCEWFFAEPAQRRLTPNATATLENYVRALKAANRPADEQRFYSATPPP
jgi:WD40 repeat protein